MQTAAEDLGRPCPNNLLPVLLPSRRPQQRLSSLFFFFFSGGKRRVSAEKAFPHQTPSHTSPSSGRLSIMLLPLLFFFEEDRGRAPSGRFFGSRASFLPLPSWRSDPSSVHDCSFRCGRPEAFSSFPPSPFFFFSKMKRLRFFKRHRCRYSEGWILFFSQGFAPFPLFFLDHSGRCIYIRVANYGPPIHTFSLSPAWRKLFLSFLPYALGELWFFAGTGWSQGGLSRHRPFFFPPFFFFFSFRDQKGGARSLCSVLLSVISS